MPKFIVDCDEEYYLYKKKIGKNYYWFGKELTPMDKYWDTQILNRFKKTQMNWRYW